MDTSKPFFVDTVRVVLGCVIELHLVTVLVDDLVLKVLNDLFFQFFIFGVVFTDIFANSIEVYDFGSLLDPFFQFLRFGHDVCLA